MVGKNEEKQMIRSKTIWIVLLMIFFTDAYAQQADTLSFEYCGVCKNRDKSFGRKLLQGSGLVFGCEGISLTILYLSPKSFSKWERPTAESYRQNLKNAFTKLPVVDKDHWYINYLGHPYQGAYLYNALRSQGAKTWQSALFATTHSFIWEFVLEGGNERPSIQDIIVTPLAGSLLGEGIHQATMAMSRNGFKWYEGIFVVVFNPMFVINNGLKAGRTTPFKP